MNCIRTCLLPAALAGAILATGCSSGGDGEARVDGNSTGTISIGITDAPVDDAAAVVVAMTEFEFKPADENEPSFRVDVEGAPRELNLLDFTNGASAIIIDGEEVPAGDYEWMRIFFDEDLSYVQLKSDGTTYPLIIPSGAQTGYKLVDGFTVPLNDSVTYMIDVDVRKSLIEPPGLGMGGQRTFLWKPAARLMNVEETGAVSGTVAIDLVDINNERCLSAEPDPLTGNAVYVFEGADAEVDDVAEEDTDGLSGPLTSDVVTLNDDTGEYEYHLMFLLPGPYTLAFTCSAMADGATDDDYPPPSDSGFDFDAMINVDVVSQQTKICDIPGDEQQTDPC